MEFATHPCDGDASGQHAACDAGKTVGRAANAAAPPSYRAAGPTGAGTWRRTCLSDRGVFSSWCPPPGTLVVAARAALTAAASAERAVASPARSGMHPPLSPCTPGRSATLAGDAPSVVSASGALRVVSGAASFSCGVDPFAAALISWRMLCVSQDLWRTRVVVIGEARGRLLVGGLSRVKESAAVVGFRRPCAHRWQALHRVLVGNDGAFRLVWLG